MADDGHTINVGVPDHVGEPLPFVLVPSDEVDRMRTENEALRRLVRWAQDAPHHAGCPAQPGYGYLDGCICGRDEVLAPFKADR